MESFKKVDIDGNIRYVNKNGLYHRTDGPASISYIGIKSWWINGKRHREDGPAVVWSDGYSEYYLNDISYSKDNWEREILNRRLKRIKDL